MFIVVLNSLIHQIFTFYASNGAYHCSFLSVNLSLSFFIFIYLFFSYFFFFLFLFYFSSAMSIDELQLTSSFSRQKHWTAKRASFFYSVHALNMKRCGVSGGKAERVWGVSVGEV